MVLSPRLTVAVFATVGEQADQLAARIVIDYLAALARGRDYLLGCPGGRTPIPVYRRLARLGRLLDIDWRKLVVVMMDDYVVEGSSGPVACPADAHYSCRRFGNVEIVGALNADRPRARQVPPSNLWLPDPAAPASYDRVLAERGGIDHFLLAGGASDGHVAFNPPGAPADGTTCIIDLADTTRRDNLKTFPRFGALGDVPDRGVSVGLGTIRAARRATLMLHGAEKGPGLARVLAATAHAPDWPATIIHACSEPAVFADAAAWQAAARRAAAP